MKLLKLLCLALLFPIKSMALNIELVRNGAIKANECYASCINLASQIRYDSIAIVFQAYDTAYNVAHNASGSPEGAAEWALQYSDWRACSNHQYEVWAIKNCSLSCSSIARLHGIEEENLETYRLLGRMYLPRLESLIAAGLWNETYEQSPKNGMIFENACNRYFGVEVDEKNSDANSLPILEIK